jgi:hypothetical protein
MPSGLYQWMHGDNFGGECEDFAGDHVGALRTRPLLRRELGDERTGDCAVMLQVVGLLLRTAVVLDGGIGQKIYECEPPAQTRVLAGVVEARLAAREGRS